MERQGFDDLVCIFIPFLCPLPPILCSKYFDYFLILGDIFVLFCLSRTQIRFFSLGSLSRTYPLLSPGFLLLPSALRISCTSPFINFSPMDCNCFSLSALRHDQRTGAISHTLMYVQHCYGLNVCVTPNLYFEILTPKYDGIRR